MSMGTASFAVMAPVGDAWLASWQLLRGRPKAAPNSCCLRQLHRSPGLAARGGGDADGSIDVLPTGAIEGMRPGTSGLRKKTRVWAETDRFTLNFAQALAVGWSIPCGVERVLVCGDGREYSEEALGILCSVLAGNGVKELLVAPGPTTTPAASAAVRRLRLDGAVLMTASHNPGGIDGDFGIKFNTGPDGAPAREPLTEAVYSASLGLQELRVKPTYQTRTIDPDEQYVAQLKQCFDWAQLRRALAGRRVLVDAMHGAAGPVAKRLLCDELGANEGDTLYRCQPRPDFGGAHPDPNLKWATDLALAAGLDGRGQYVQSPKIDLGCALDGDGDRNMIVGAGCFVTPSDSLAVLASRAHKIKWFRERGGLKALARSMPTSQAVDRVAAKLGVPCFETPTGWKYFGNLMDAYQPLLCGEESFGTGADHIREKDGLFALLAWLSVLDDGEQVSDVLKKHWLSFGRDLYCRFDFEGCDSVKADRLFAHLRLLSDDQQQGESYSISEFEYRDPVDNSVSSQQGFVLTYPKSNERAVFRLSGTGSAGATVRLYLERYIPEPSPADIDAVPSIVLTDLAVRAMQLADFATFLGTTVPDVVT